MRSSPYQYIMKPLVAAVVISLLSIGVITPIYAQCAYNCDTSHNLDNSQHNQVKTTDKGSLMVGFYTDPENPGVSDKTTFEISFEDKDSRVLLSNIDYQVSILKNNSPVFQTPVTHSVDGKANVQYQFKDSGKYQIAVYVIGIDSQKISQESASFDLTIGPSTVPEFPFAMPILLASISSLIIFYRMRFGKTKTLQ